MGGCNRAASEVGQNAVMSCHRVCSLHWAMFENDPWGSVCWSECYWGAGANGVAIIMRTCAVEMLDGLPQLLCWSLPLEIESVIQSLHPSALLEWFRGCSLISVRSSFPAPSQNLLLFFLFSHEITKEENHHQISACFQKVKWRHVPTEHHFGDMFPVRKGWTSSMCQTLFEGKLSNKRKFALKNMGKLRRHRQILCWHPETGTS